MLFGRVTAVDLGNDFIVVEDPNTDIYNLLTSEGEDQITMFDHHDKNINGSAVHTAGVWGDGDIDWDNGPDTTAFTSGSSFFPDYADGWFLQPDASVPVFFPIIDATASTLTVAGNLEGVASAGDYYFIIPPVGIDKTNGAVSTAPGEPMTRNLAFGYLYSPPTAGVYATPEMHEGLEEAGIYGAQPGLNLSGQYYCWNRWYDPTQGRWTTTDPATRPWTNLHMYVDNSVTSRSDPNGLGLGEAQTLAGNYMRLLGSLPRNMVEKIGWCDRMKHILQKMKADRINGYSEFSRGLEDMDLAIRIVENYHREACGKIEEARAASSIPPTVMHWKRPACADKPKSVGESIDSLVEPFKGTSGDATSMEVVPLVGSRVAGAGAAIAGVVIGTIFVGMDSGSHGIRIQMDEAWKAAHEKAIRKGRETYCSIWAAECYMELVGPVVEGKLPGPEAFEACAAAMNHCINTGKWPDGIPPYDKE